VQKISRWCHFPQNDRSNPFFLDEKLLPLVITGVLWLAAMSAWMISTGAWTKDLYPEDQRGQFAGYFILF
jgi:hypothetical protein